MQKSIKLRKDKLEREREITEIETENLIAWRLQMSYTYEKKE